MSGAFREPGLAVVRAHVSCVLLLIFFALLYATTLDSYGMLRWDEAEYASMGRSVLRGEGFSISGQPKEHRLPLLPLAVAGCLAVAPQASEVTLKRVTLAFTLMTLLVVYAAAAAELGRIAGFAAAACLGLFPSFWSFTAQLMSEMPFLGFFTAAVVCLQLGLYRDVRFLYGSACCAALALLTRYTGVLLVPLALVFLAFALLSGDEAVRGRIFSKHVVLATLLLLGLLLPWLIRQQLRFGDALIGFRYASTQLQVFLPGVSFPWYFYLQVIPEMISELPALLLVAGAVWAIRSRNRFGLHCLATVVGFIVWFSFYRFKETRALVPALPFIAILVGAGFTKGIVGSLPPRLSAATLGVVLGIVFALNHPRVTGTLRSTVALGSPSFPRAMQFLQQHTAPSTVIVGANYPQIFWYADRMAIDYPEEPQLREALQKSTWIVITNFERGQKDYVRGLLQLVTAADRDAGDVVSFSDARFFTIVVRSTLLLQRLADNGVR